MIIEFSFNNFRSFKDDVVFSMVSSAGNKNDNTVDFEGLSILPSAVVYGANASGKSNLLKAFAFMQHLVLNKDKTMQSTDKLSYNPFRLSTETENASTSFDIVIEIGGKKYKYGFEYDSLCVYSEYLYVYESTMPTKVFEFDIDESISHINPKFKELKNVTHLKNSLFLWKADQNGNAYSHNVLEWFNSCHFLDYRTLALPNPFYSEILKNEELRETLSEILKLADLGVEKIFQQKQLVSSDSLNIRNLPKGTVLEEISIKTSHKKFDEKNKPVDDVVFDLGLDESAGTNKFFFVIGPILDTIRTGSFLLLDELDANLHPELTALLIKLFNDKDINKRGAQLLFTSQDTNLLNHELFHKSQIWFVEKDEYSASHLTSLSDFKNVRDTDKFDKNYIKGKYGAVPFLGQFDSKLLEL